MRSIWAVAINTIRQVIRLKIAAVFVILLLLLLPVMGFKMTGDGTLMGRIQAFVSYGMSLTVLLLSLLTIFAAVYALTSDVRDKQVYTVLTKPIRRFQFVLGKLLGIILLDACLLLLFSIVVYSITVTMPKFIHADEEQVEQVQNEFYTARASLKPAEPDVTADVEKRYEQLKRNIEIPAGVDEDPVARRNYKKELASRIKLRKQAAAVGEELDWEFTNVKPLSPKQNIFVRFKYDVSRTPFDFQVYSRWVIGDLRQFQTAGPLDTPIYSLDRMDTPRTAHEFQVPADAVAPDGYLGLAFLNVPLNPMIVIFPLGEGIEVLYKADTFTANFFRAVLLVFFQLVFLAALAVFAGSFLSFPVAILFCLAIFTMANMSGFIGESFDFPTSKISWIYEYSLKPLINMLPELDHYNASTYLVPARLLSWKLLGWLGFKTLFLRTLPLIILSLIIFAYREIAKVIV
jgi:hypothetical protein